MRYSPFLKLVENIALYLFAKILQRSKDNALSSITIYNFLL